MTKVLMFNIKGKKAIEIKNLCRKLYIETETIEKDKFNQKMYSLLNPESSFSEGEGGEFEEEMLYLADFSDVYLDIFLKALRVNKCPVALKAVMTETNLNFTPFELYKEISAEHKAMQSGESVHQA